MTCICNLYTFCVSIVCLHNRNCGRPKIDVPIEEIELLRNLRFSWTRIATLLDISRSTLYRRLEEGISLSTTFSNISDRDLDRVIGAIKATHPNDGEHLIIGHLTRQNLEVE